MPRYRVSVWLEDPQDVTVDADDADDAVDAAIDTFRGVDLLANAEWEAVEVADDRA